MARLCEITSNVTPASVVHSPSLSSISTQCRGRRERDDDQQFLVRSLPVRKGQKVTVVMIGESPAPVALPADLPLLEDLRRIGHAAEAEHRTGLLRPAFPSTPPRVLKLCIQ